MLRSHLSHQQKPANKDRGGFTLIELLVVMLLLSLISGILISILSHSSALVSQGTNLISQHQRSRSAIDKMAPIVATAVSGGGSAAILVPSLKSANPVYDQRLRFNTTEDFLHPDYDPRGGTFVDAFNPSAPAFYIYEFAFIPDNASDPDSLGRIELHRLTPGTFAIDTSNGHDPRAVAHRVQGFRCILINSNTVEVIVDTFGERKGPQGNLIEVVESQQALLSIPTASY